jgi:hypothetical protein
MKDWSWFFYEQLGYRINEGDKEEVDALNATMYDAVEPFRKLVQKWETEKRVYPSKEIEMYAEAQVNLCRLDLLIAIQNDFEIHKCGDCGYFDPELDVHPWFLEGCTLKDTHQSVAHHADSLACPDFKPKEETK